MTKNFGEKGARLAVVTGAGRGIGAASAEALAASGYRCIGVDLATDPEAPWPSYACDLSDLAQLEAVFARIAEEHGVPDLLVNCAGIVRHKSFFDVTPEDFDLTMAINSRGLFFASQIVARQMVAAKKPGIFVQIASVGPFMGTGDPAYGMSKGAVVALTKSMARALAPHGIRVNAVAPGLIDTAMNTSMPDAVRSRYNAIIPLGRTGIAHDIGGVVAFLASDAAGYMTGEIVQVNGGMY
jgi:NAD(P)-dependent dehydrogenase (short-subunit alcohol dehydrogenase family)